MKLLNDTWLMFPRYLVVFLRNPAWVVIGVRQPSPVLVLLPALLTPLAHVPVSPAAGAARGTPHVGGGARSGGGARALPAGGRHWNAQ